MERKMIDRKMLLQEINSIITVYCEGCFLQKQNIKESGKRKSHKFCISQCTVGSQLKELGNRLADK